MSRAKAGSEQTESASAAMASVVASIAPTLKAAGFRKQRHTFNRVSEPGLVHVVNFQVGQFPIGAYEIPGLRPNLYGKFTVNLGVFVHEVHELTQRSAAPAFVHEYSCEFRVRLGELLTPPGDYWWSLSTKTQQLGAELLDHLRLYAEPWFVRYATRDAILNVPVGGELPEGWPARASVSLAVMLAHRGEEAKARALLRDYLVDEKRNPRNPKHREWVLELARRLGFEREQVE